MLQVSSLDQAAKKNTSAMVFLLALEKEVGLLLFIPLHYHSFSRWTSKSFFLAGGSYRQPCIYFQESQPRMISFVSNIPYLFMNESIIINTTTSRRSLSRPFPQLNLCT